VCTHDSPMSCKQCPPLYWFGWKRLCWEYGPSTAERDYLWVYYAMADQIRKMLW
jgi:hypothetical protein